ncbi:MAG: type II toxin-antitoxin system prevent-host-death family antitoxin [Bacillota bacterium]|nr:type II toxin-antitoxin system prevent-host-death family antitoxin [Bacillota bacterium]
MPNIKPVSDLRNYGEVLRDVAIGQPVFLTKNGYGRYAVLDIEEYREYERMRAMNRLLEELDRGLQSEKEEPLFSLEDVEAALGVTGEPHG